MKMRSVVIGLAIAVAASAQAPRPRVRDLGIQVGILPSGPLDAITDVGGVEVGQVTLDDHKNIHTGVTAILPHAGNLFQHKVPGAVFVGNAFGKLMGSTQIEELGRIETPILLTSTLNVPRVADALISYMLQLPGNEHVLSVNPVVGETNDGGLNDIRSRPVGEREVFEAIRSAKGGPVQEGAVGAGAGTIAFGFKGGIGTASRRLPARLGGWTVGVLVQTNFGGILDIAGAPVGRELGQYYLKNQLAGGAPNPLQSPDGSCMIVVATDAPLGSRNLRRLAARTMMGLARTGSAASNGSGDYAIAFSTFGAGPNAATPRVPLESRPAFDARGGVLAPARGPRAPQAGAAPSTTATVPAVERVTNEAMSPLFLAVIEATQEAIYDSLFQARTTTGEGRTIEALPLAPTLAILRKYHVMH